MRGKPAHKRIIAPDARYNSVIAAKLMNHVMRDGEKTVARRVVYGALDQIAAVTKAEALPILEKAVANAEPRLEVRSRRVGGATYQVPREVQGNRRQFLAMNWIVGAARSRKGKPMAQRLAEELLAASRNEGAAVQKRENMHRMADANRAFAHLAW